MMHICVHLVWPVYTLMHRTIVQVVHPPLDLIANSAPHPAVLIVHLEHLFLELGALYAPHQYA